MPITRLALENSRVLVLFIALLVFGGLITFANFPSAEDPTIQIRNVTVMAPAPGLSAAEVETLIARPIEEAMRDIPEVTDISTSALRDRAIIDLEVTDYTDDVGAVVQEIRNRAERVEADLPDQSVGVLVEDDIGLVSIASIALWSDGFSHSRMREAAEDIRSRIYTLDGVRKVQLYGVQEERIFIEFDPYRTAQLGIGPAAAMQAIQDQNTVVPTGVAVADGRRLVVEPSGSLVDEEDVANVTFQLPGTGQLFRIGDIADVRRGYQDPPDNPAYFDGRPAVIISVSTHEGINNVAFGEVLNTELETIQANLPIGLELDYASFQPDLIKVAVDGALLNVYQTLFIVLFVVMLFLGLRAGIIVGIFVPLTMLAGVLLMSIFGVELQRMSIAAVIIALGLLVDNGIVMAEDIRVRMERGAAPNDAAQAAGKSLAIPLLSSSLTTMAAFMPLTLIAGAAGEYVGTLGLVVIFLLGASWVLSMTVTPALCAWFLKVKPTGEAKKDLTSDDFGGALYVPYKRFIGLLLSMRVAFLVLVLLILAGSVFTLSRLPNAFFPTSERNQFLIYVDLEAGADIRETERVTRRLAHWLGDREINPEVTSNVAYVGEGGPRFYLALSPMKPAPNRAFLLVNVESPRQIPAVLERTNAYVDEHLPEAVADAKSMWFGPSETGHVEIRVVGEDANTLYNNALAIEAAFRDLPGATGVSIDWENRVLELDLQIDQERARRAGVSSAAVASSLHSAFNGLEVTSLREGRFEVPVVIRGEDVARESLAAVEGALVWSDRDQDFVRLGEIADGAPRWVYPRIERRNLERTVTVGGRSTVLGARDVVSAMQATLDGLDLPPGVRIEIGGEPEDQAKAQSRLYANFPLALGIIALLLVAQFNSIRRGGIILLTIPLVLIGAVLGLLVMQAAFGFMVLLGLVSLAGIVINNGIVLIDRIVEEERKGKPQVDAIMVACLSRLRPILMTTLTTALGLIPLILFGGALFYGMASAIAFGLLVGTVLTLGVVPVLYSLMIREDASGG
ncbi:MAG: efflux RND transporter permease subunit [Sphingomonadales bacterium]|nr:MAG: efflux RND transporter permease subunit [Sphingomonadales bacterium]